MQRFAGRSQGYGPGLSPSLSRFNRVQNGVQNGDGQTWWAFSHVHYAPTPFEVNFIHQRSHPADAAAMRGLKLFCGSRVRKSGAVKSFSFVSDHNGHLSIRRTSAHDVNLLAWVFMIAVNNSIRQGFSHGDFNLDLASLRTSASLDEQHELVHER